MTSPATGAPDFPEYAPVPAIAKGAVLNSHGYHVWQVERNLYAVTDNVYMSAFLTTPDGVVIFDAPPNLGHNVRRAVDEITAANGTTNQVTHMVYSHHHADHQGASSLFGRDIVRIGHEETRRLLLRDNDPARPVPDVTFPDTHTLEVGGERVELAWHGPNHSPDNIYIHFPDHDTLMFIDVVNAGWIPIYNLNLSDDVIGYTGAPAIALDHPWKHLISGHLGRVAALTAAPAARSIPDRNAPGQSGRPGWRQPGLRPGSARLEAGCRPGAPTGFCGAATFSVSRPSLGRDG
jgi:glyoxylase-like metal-dependent hydrolase (beta-lactamase superfamily II)